MKIFGYVLKCSFYNPVIGINCWPNAISCRHCFVTWSVKCSTYPLVSGCLELSHMIFLMLRKKELPLKLIKFRFDSDFTIECLNVNCYYKSNQRLRLHPDERHLSLIVANLIWFDFLEVGQSFSLSVRTQTYLKKKLMMEKIKIKTCLVFNDYQRPIFSIHNLSWVCKIVLT